MAYDRGKIHETYLRPIWPAYPCLRGAQIIQYIADAYDLCSHATEISENQFVYSLAEVTTECKASIIAALQTFIDDLTLLE